MEKIGLKKAHRAAQTHLNEEHGLLPRGQRGQVDGSQAADSHGADTVEERVNICNVIASIASVEYPREDHRHDCAERQG